VDSEDKNCASCDWNIRKNEDQNLQLLPGHLLVTELQKITLMNTTHIIFEVLG